MKDSSGPAFLDFRTINGTILRSLGFANSDIFRMYWAYEAEGGTFRTLRACGS